MIKKVAEKTIEDLFDKDFKSLEQKLEKLKKSIEETNRMFEELLDKLKNR